MKKLLIRHAQSEANRLTRVAFGVEGANLTGRGQEQAVRLGVNLEEQGYDKTQIVATSKLVRTQQTAYGAGFNNCVIHSDLNEIQTDVHPVEMARNAIKNILPKEAYERAELLLHNAPIEEIWFSHGLVIAGIREVLGLQYHRLVPEFCEITEIHL